MILSDMKTQGFRRRPRVLLAAASAAAAALFAGSAVSSSTAAARATASIPGVVDINTNLRYESAAAAGTGIVLTSSGEVLTNNHVIRGATTIRVVVPQSGRRYAARVLGYDVADDVALLKLAGASHLQTVSLGHSATLRVGQSVTAVGNAGGSGTLRATNGKVTGLGRTITASDDQGGAERLSGLIETNAALEPGDSGGPLLDSAHRVIGMDTAASAGFAFRAAANNAYAIPIGRALSIARQIAAGHASANVHIGATPFLGVQVANVASSFGSSRPWAIVVAGVVPGSPADDANLAPGNIITSLDGHALTSPQTITTLLLHKAPASKVRLTWTDESGNQLRAMVTLASGPPQ